MIRHRFSIYRRINLGIDAVLCAAAYIASGLLLSGREWTVDGIYAFLAAKHLPLIAISALWPALLVMNGFYPSSRIRTLTKAIGMILRVCFQGLLWIVFFLYLSRAPLRSFAEYLAFALAIFVLLVLKEVVLRQWIGALRSEGKNFRSVLLVGTPETVQDVYRVLEQNKFLGLRVIGYLKPPDVLPGKAARKKMPRLRGSFENLEAVLHAQPVDQIVVTCSDRYHSEIQKLIFTAEAEGTEVWISSDIFSVNISRFDTDELMGRPFLIFRTGPTFSIQMLLKDLLDFLAGAFFFAIGLPIVLAAAIMIKLGSRGPVFYAQERCGLRGRRFRLYKLRTMVEGADADRKTLLRRNIMKGPVFKVLNDPRVTKIGRFLRKASIDELPQLWNVLKGEMSLVGPRPPLPEEVKKYEAWQRRRLSMKPGITGLWQVSGRNAITDFREWAELDLRYIDNWSLTLDLRILWRTIFVLFKGV